jgi:hypothetical protein
LADNAITFRQQNNHEEAIRVLTAATLKQNEAIEHLWSAINNQEAEGLKGRDSDILSVEGSHLPLPISLSVDFLQTGNGLQNCRLLIREPVECPFHLGSQKTTDRDGRGILSLGTHQKPLLGHCRANHRSIHQFRSR